MLAHHAQIDHALLADALAGVEDSQAEIAQWKHDEAQMRAMVPQLQAGPATARPALRQLQTLMAAHAVRETESLFPLAERLLGDRRLEQLFYEAERRKHHQSENDGLIFPANRFGIE
jgi:hypothetical protein